MALKPGVRLRRFKMTAGLLLLAARLGAQTAPLPVLPPEPEPTPTPTPTPDPTKPGAAGATPRTPLAPPRTANTTETAVSDSAVPLPWEYAVGAMVGYDSNVAFRRGGPSSLFFSPRGEIARNVRSSRGRLRAVAAGRWAGYPSEPELNRSYAAFGLASDYRTSPSTVWRLDASYEFGYTDASTILTQQGVSYALVQMETLNANLGLTQRLGTRTTMRVDGRIYRVEFDAPGFATGQSLRGTFLLERQLSPRNAGGLTYSFEQILDGAGNPYPTHFGSLQWTRVFNPQNAVLLEGGVGYTPDAAQVGLNSDYSFYGGVSFIRQIRRSTITALFRREVTPAFGLGVSLLASRLGVRADVPLQRNWRFGMTADYARPDNTDEATPAFPPNSDFSISVGRRLGRYLEVSGETRYRRRGGDTVALPSVSSYQAALFVSLAPRGRGYSGGARAY